MSAVNDLLEQLQVAQRYRSIRGYLLRRVPAYLALVILASTLGGIIGLEAGQIASIAVFFGIILGALLFWRFRLAFALLGLSVLLALGLTNIESIIEFAALDIILFLFGMMILIGFLEERHFFERIVDWVTDSVGPHAFRLITVLMGLSALFAALVDEVTSILFMGATVFQLAGRYRVSPVPFLIVVIFATNVGSSATVVGNPIGIMIALRAGLTFLDFLRWAMPISVLALSVSIPILLFTFRKPIKELGESMFQADKANKENSIREPLFSKNMRLPWLLFVGTILLLVLHTSVEKLLGLDKNTMLLGTSLAVAGLILMLDREHARDLVERRVEWWSLTFFLLLFASVGTLSLTGVTSVLANRLAEATAGNETALFFSFTWVGGIASAFMDNILAIATFIPIVQELGNLGLDIFPLWWGLLMAGTFLGNLTMIGSTANIVAIGMMERRRLGSISMGEWFKATAFPAVLTLAIASLLLYLQLLR